MKSLAVLFVVLSSAVAYADGFECQTVDGSLNLKTYNHTQASDGTRNSAVLVLSDANANAGEKTLARFTDVETTLSNRGANYVAKVDLRRSNIENEYAEVLGTTLREVKKVLVNIDFNYAEPVSAGHAVDGTVVLLNRQGGSASSDLSCVRYLKN